MKRTCRNEKEHLNELYNGFFHKPHISESMLERHKDELILIQKAVGDLLLDFVNFLGIEFYDTNFNGIEIRGFHKNIDGYSYGEQVTIKYDFSNMTEAINNFVDLWKKFDTEEYLKYYRQFIDFGNKYGWD